SSLFVNMEIAVKPTEEIEDAVIAVPPDGVIRENLNRDIKLDLSTAEKKYEHGYFPISLIYNSNDLIKWIMGATNTKLAMDFNSQIIEPAKEYKIPAIELDKETEKAAVATVFEKVNIGGLPLNVFELLTAVFAGDSEYYAETGKDFRLNDDWQ